MERERFTRACVSLLAATALFVAVWLFSPWLPAWSPDGHAGGSTPKTVLSCRQRDLGRVTQGDVVRAVFPVTNAGNRRLILSPRAAGCCGRPADFPQLIVAPGDSAKLRVEFDTAGRVGQVAHTTLYTTNDPALPQFTLRVPAVVDSKK